MPDKEVQTRYIVKNDNICFGKARIRDTRMAVVFIVSEYIHQGMSPYDILDAHPHLTLAQIHAALSYYYDNRIEIDRWLLESAEFYEKMKKRQDEERAHSA